MIINNTMFWGETPSTLRSHSHTAEDYIVEKESVATTHMYRGEISDFHCGVDQVCTLQCLYTAYGGDCLQTFRNGLLVQ
jgi:hypothetical protein